MNEIDQLKSAIRLLYEVFKYPRLSKIEYCPCGCTKPEEVEPILSAAVAELPFSILANYSFSAMTTQGSVEDFKYFLPRLLEGIAEEPYFYCPETLFGKLHYAQWLTWKQNEQDAVRNYLDNLWCLGLRSHPLDAALPAFAEIEDLVGSIGSTGDDLRRYLQFWSQETTEEADRHLVRLVTMCGEDFASDKKPEGFWSSVPEQALELRRWLLRADIIRRVENSSRLLAPDGFDHLFEPALHALQMASRNAI